ncbi:VOC family protein [Halobacillus sp. MO56]
MKLGAFSISLTVKDINKSKDFYEKLGFQSFGGNTDQNWIIMKNEDCVIGLFQGMFEKNILTFNPGWNQNAENIEPFTDVRELQKQLKENDIKLLSEADEASEGPENIIIEDPDGNPILIDQHR